MSDLTILIPLDGSKQAEHALSFLPALRPIEGLQVRLLTVAESDASISGDQETRREKLAEEYLGDVTDRAAASYGVPVDCVCRTGRPYEQILEEAHRGDVNLLLMTTHGRTITDPGRLGSVADKVVRGASCPTLVVGPHASVPPQIKRITVPLDGSTLAAEALPVARSLAERLGSSIRLVRVVRPPVDELEEDGTLGADVLKSMELTASRYLAEAKRALGTRAPVETAVLIGPPVDALLTDLEEHKPDLMVMTSHGQTGFIPWALGSVTDRLLRGPVPILVLRPQSEAGLHMAPLLRP